MAVSEISKEDVKLKKLRAMKMNAALLLGLMAVIYILANVFKAEWGGLAYVKAFSEAAMIGALADWFAVAALFKRPLGLPLKHTAIIPNNKDRLGRNLADFIETEILKGNLKDVVKRLTNNKALIGMMLSALFLIRSEKRIVEDINGFIVREFEQWDKEEFSRKIETQIGSDLQWIRINGTLVGGLVGLVIFVVSGVVW